MDYYGPMLPFQRFATLLLAASLGAHAQAPDTPAAAAVPSTMDGELFYQLLLGELTAQGGDPGTGYSLLLDAARKTGDPRLFQRAVEIALQARSGDSALQAARAWKQAQPNSRDANRYVLQILIGLNRLADTVEPLKREIALVETRERASAIAMLPRFFARSSDKKLATSVLEQALADHMSSPATGPAAWTALGRMHLDTGDAAAALDDARRGQALDARADGPALLALALMSPARPQAEALVRKYLEGKPQPEVRMAYARALLDGQRYAEATEQIRIITAEKPDYEEAWLIQGTLELQDNKPDAAEKSIQRYVELVQSHKNGGAGDQGRGLAQAYLSLAQIAEQRKDFAQAEKWLSKITNTEDLIRAQSRRAGILARQGKVDEARQLVLKALEYAPGDPFITDSLGWVEFRSGNKPEALRILQGAYKVRPDAEIAAHLGEVLWSMGQREQAMNIWREGAKLNADNETLTATLKRLRVKL
jgi:tetratricopeptide (TPR) repeat protein